MLGVYESSLCEISNDHRVGEPRRGHVEEANNPYDSDRV